MSMYVRRFKKIYLAVDGDAKYFFTISLNDDLRAINFQA